MSKSCINAQCKLKRNRHTLNRIYLYLKHHLHPAIPLQLFIRRCLKQQIGNCLEMCFEEDC